MIDTFYTTLAERIAEALKATQYDGTPVYDVWQGNDGRTVFVRHADRSPYSIAVIRVEEP
jgi:flavin-dependent dehydrogenase